MAGKKDKKYHADVEGEADVGDEGDDVAVGQVGDGEPPHKAYDGDHKDRPHIEAQDGTAGASLGRPGGENHQRHCQPGQQPFHDMETGRHVGGPQQPDNMQQEESYHGLQQAALAGHLPFLAPAALEHPVGQQQGPHDIGHADTGHHAAPQEGEQHKVDAAMNLGSHFFSSSMARRITLSLFSPPARRPAS